MAPKSGPIFMRKLWDKVNNFNNKLALAITNGVSTVWCAYIFAGIALISLPTVIATHQLLVVIAWIAQTFLQLVLLSIIMVGQKLQADSTITHVKKHLEQHTRSIHEIHKNHLAEVRRILSKKWQSFRRPN